MTRPLDFFSYENGTLSSQGVSLAKIADAVGTPFYVYSSEAFLRPLRTLQKGLASIDSLICFALKSNSNLSVLKLLANAGAGMDTVSGGELFRAGVAGAKPDKVVFSGVGKTPGEMRQALRFGGSGIFSFNVESVHELLTLNEVAKEEGKKAPVALRFNPDVNPKTHPYISTGLKKNKFGLNRAEILEMVRGAKELSGIDIRGISIHIGSQLLSLSPLDDAFARLKHLIAEVNPILPRPISFVDLGGGVGITYKKEKSPSLEAYCRLILKHFGPKARLKSPLKVLIEPGRTISGNSGALVTEVLYRKGRKTKDFLVVDAAMNDLIRPALYQSYHEIVPLRKPDGAARKKSTDIVGPVCESADCFASGRLFPSTIGQGDLLAILSAGAYGFSMASNYNSRPRPPEVLIEGGKFAVIRARETYDDLIRGERA